MWPRPFWPGTACSPTPFCSWAARLARGKSAGGCARDGLVGRVVRYGGWSGVGYGLYRRAADRAGAAASGARPQDRGFVARGLRVRRAAGRVRRMRCGKPWRLTALPLAWPSRLRTTSWTKLRIRLPWANPVGSDAAHGKMTYPRLVGLEKSRELGWRQVEKAQAALQGLDGAEADFLRALVHYMMQRAA